MGSWCAAGGRLHGNLEQRVWTGRCRCHGRGEAERTGGGEALGE